MNKKFTNRLLAAFAVAIIFAGGAFAQSVLTIYNSDGTAANGAILYSINSSTGVSTTLATDGGAGDGDAVAGQITVALDASTNYLISNAGGTQWNSVASAVDVSRDVYLNANFTETIREYAASNTLDKITHSQDMPFWVYPSPVHNPSWTAPAADYATQATIETNLTSSFSWALDGVAEASVTNYVEITAGGDLTGSAVATAAHYLEVSETSDAAFGSCAGETVRMFFNAINPPYAQFNGTAASAFTINTAAVQEFGSGCEDDVNAINPAVAFANTNEEFPYYVRLIYNAYNATAFDGTDITLGAPIAFTSNPTSPLGTDGATAANQTTNPMEFNATPSNLYAAPQAFTALNNEITVYAFDLNEWNAKISRKSDYIAHRTAGGVDDANINSNTWSWYDNAALANTWDASALVTVGYVIVFPTPVTGPIYHINNQWGL
ncbi:MAG: hypothetical protein JXA77_01050 [Bacteroidales bacterium]|nr:hypothetical protein [Bacteroidales bacterium]MBN2818389.1 hypothetical protein [Bacteroidales bacterium]